MHYGGPQKPIRLIDCYFLVDLSNFHANIIEVYVSEDKIT